MDALPRLWANSATICWTAALSGAPGTAASLTRTYGEGEGRVHMCALTPTRDEGRNEGK